MKRKRLLSGMAAIALLAAPAAGAGKPANLLAPEPASAAAPATAPAAPPPCVGAGAERAALQAERGAINRTIGDIALGKHRRKRKASGGEVAAGVAGAAASVLLPFGVGALIGAGAQAAAKSGRKAKPAPPEPDVPAMIDRLHAIDARLLALKACE